MRLVPLSLLGVLAGVYLAGAVHAEAPKLDEHLADFKPFVGKTWKGEFKRSTPEKPLFDVSRWEVALNGKAVRIMHAVNDGVYGGETIVMWNPKTQKLEGFYFTTAGFFTQSTFEFKDGKIHSTEKVTGNQQGITEVRAVSELRADGKLHVKSQYFKGDEAHEGHEILYSEAPDAKVAIQ